MQKITDITVDTAFLDKLSIYKLREFARCVGVRAPTTKTKAVLIKEIRMIKNNELKPHFPAVKSGRPVISENIFEENNVDVRRYKELLSSMKSLKNNLDEQIFIMENYLLYKNKQ